MLGDRFSYSYFSFNRRSENRASLGKPIVPIEVEWRSLVNLYRISMQEDTDWALIHINDLHIPKLSLPIHQRGLSLLKPYYWRRSYDDDDDDDDDGDDALLPVICRTYLVAIS